MNRLLLLLILPCLGCIPLMTPPARLDAGIGVEFHDSNTSLVAPFRASFHPLHIVDTPQERTFDAGVGWNWILSTHLPFTHGPAIEAGLLFPVSDISRFGVHAKLNYLFSTDSTQGHTIATLQGTAELLTFIEDGFSSCDDGCYIGIALGEISAGAFIEASTALHGESRTWIAGGLLFRTPFNLGVLLLMP